MGGFSNRKAQSLGRKYMYIYDKKPATSHKFRKKNVIALPRVPILSGPSRFRGRLTERALKHREKIWLWVELFYATNCSNLQHFIELDLFGSVNNVPVQILFYYEESVQK